MLYVLVIIFLLLLIINYFGCGCDFFNPAVIFSLMNLVSSMLCAFSSNVYEITIHANTAGVLALGGFVFTVINLVIESKVGNKQKIRLSGNEGSKLSFIIIRRYWIVLFILLELIVAYFMMKYIINVVKAYSGVSYDFATSLGKYNNIVKNHGKEFRDLSVSSGAIYVYGWPLCRLLCVFLGAVVINNYIITKKFDMLLAIPAAIPVLMSFFSGSRSNAFRFLTVFIAEFIVIYRHYVGSYRKGNAKILRNLLVFSSITVVAFMLIIRIIGRTTAIDPYQYFVAYLGGPFFNLDIYLQNPYHSDFFGQETFQRFYSYIGSRFSIKNLQYDLNLPYNRWHGIYLGNVYTMYFMFIEDFGYWGIVPLTAICAFFYIAMYSKLMNVNIPKSVVGPRLFIYSYLFNDVIMLTFSNRFYENVLSAVSIRIYLWLLIIWYFYKKGLFRVRLSCKHISTVQSNKKA